MSEETILRKIAVALYVDDGVWEGVPDAEIISIVNYLFDKHVGLDGFVRLTVEGAS